MSESAFEPIVEPVSESQWPSVGSVSPDRVVVAGRRSRLFLFEGSNDEYAGYCDPSSASAADSWVSVLRARAARLAHLPHLTLMVPNKTTCLPQDFPLPRASDTTFLWARLRSLCVGDARLHFPTELVAPDRRAAGWGDGWGLVNSHWSSFGAASAALDVLSRFTLPGLPVTSVEGLSVIGGDLGHRWPGPPLLEQWTRRLELDLPAPQILHDNADGDHGRGVVGRTIEWICPGAVVDARLLVVGNSFAGPGLLQSELVYWLSRAFRSCVFLHTADLPADALSLFAPDVVLVQTIERFLPTVPQDTVTVAELDAQHRAARGSR